MPDASKEIMATRDIQGSGAGSGGGARSTLTWNDQIANNVAAQMSGAKYVCCILVSILERGIALAAKRFSWTRRWCASILWPLLSAHWYGVLPSLSTAVSKLRPPLCKHQQLRNGAKRDSGPA